MRYIGIIRWYFETGCEGVAWAFYEDGKSGHDALHFIEKGDHLIIYDEDGNKLFDGEIIPDDQAGWMESPRNPGHGQPSALGRWIHWTQLGWQPDDWARLFMREDGKSLRAELVQPN